MVCENSIDKDTNPSFHHILAVLLDYKKREDKSVLGIEIPKAPDGEKPPRALLGRKILLKSKNKKGGDGDSLKGGNRPRKGPLQETLNLSKKHQKRDVRGGERSLSKRKKTSTQKPNIAKWVHCVDSRKNRAAHPSFYS